MDFSEKLKRAFAKAASSNPASPGLASQEPMSPALASESVRALLMRRAAHLHTKRPEVDLPEGQEVHNERGCCFVRRLCYSLAHVHGGATLGAVRSVDAARLAERARDKTLATWRLEECLFLDTETTGLAGGAGTIVFLCGLGYCEGEQLVLEQVFLRAFSEEAAALAHVALRLREHPLLVTFVGKAFDRHRLAARMSVNRVGGAILAQPHLDLYYLARRAWKDRLPNVKLRTVEQEMLGLLRSDDLPGSAAPVAFLDWVRDRSGPIDRVFEHNRLDVLSLVTLLARLASE